MFYDVTVQRVEYRSHTFRVEANDEDHAEERGLDESCDHDFDQDPISSADECVTYVRAVPAVPTED